MFFYVSLQELTTALEKNPHDAEYYCQRAYAHILLQKYAGKIFRQHRILLKVYYDTFFTEDVFNLQPNIVITESVTCNLICCFYS